MEESADVILDFVDGVSEIDADIETRLPKYNCNRPVGSSMIHKLECFECRLCAKYMDTDKTAEIHSRTTSHHRNFLKFLNEKANETKIAQKRAAAALEESERKRMKLEEVSKQENGKAEELYDPSEATSEGSKQVKLEEGSEPVKLEEVSKEENGKAEELYDPSEATGEGDDEESKTGECLFSMNLFKFQVITCKLLKDVKEETPTKDDNATDDDSAQKGGRSTRRRGRAAKF